MNSIGNDVVALSKINAERTHQYRFYSKILSPAEEQIYITDPHISTLPFEHYVWLLWSVKESAYKFLKRLNHQLVFSPTRIIVTQLQLTPDNSLVIEFTGTVTFEAVQLYFSSTITTDYIHTVVNSSQIFTTIQQKVNYLHQATYEYQSAKTKELALNSMKSYLGINNLLLSKHTMGYPEISVNQAHLPVYLSLAHDGHYAAYAFYTTDTNKLQHIFLQTALAI